MSMFDQIHLFSINLSLSRLAAAPILPMLMAASNLASSVCIPCCDSKKAETCALERGAKESDRHRERRVGSSPPALGVIKTISESAGGSSSVFNKAFCADKFIRMAGSMIAIFDRSEEHTSELQSPDH